MRNGDGASHPSPARVTDWPPSNVEAERGVIGAVLFANEVLADVLAVLPRPEMFFRAEHARYWRGILELHAAGEPVDFLTLDDWCKRNGGSPDLETWHECRQAVCHELDAPKHARIIADKSLLRDAIEALEDARRDCYAQADSAANVLTRAADRLAGIRDVSMPNDSLTAGDLVDDVLEQMDKRRNGEAFGVLTGFHKLDGTDGLQAQDLILLAARPSMGKTAFALNVAEFAAVSWGIPTLFVSLEMSNPALVQRVLASRSRINMQTIRSGQDLTDPEYARLGAARADIKTAPLYLVRRPRRSCTDVCNEVRRYHKRKGIKLVAIDYLQLMTGDNPRDTEVQALTKISGMLKGLANELEIPVLALSQLNRNTENRTDTRPTMGDLRGSGALEQDADMILFLHRPEYYDPGVRVGEADVIIAKHRNGPTGEFPVTFHKHLVRFEDPQPTTNLKDAPF